MYATTMMIATFIRDLTILKRPFPLKIVFLRYSPTFGTIFEIFGSIGFKLKIKPLVWIIFPAIAEIALIKEIGKTHFINTS